MAEHTDKQLIISYPSPQVSFCFLLFAGLLLSFSSPAYSASCLWVSSYAPGYEWNDGIGKGIHSVLDDKCEVLEFHMDTKRNKGADFVRKQAAEARKLISRIKPDVVIASDDNASRYLVAPYFKDSKTPFVVCGINWSVKEYGYPYSNLTGIVEIMPVLPLLRTIKEILSINKGRALMLSADMPTARKQFQYLQRHFKNNNMQLEARFVSTFAQWKEYYQEGQEFDAILLLNNAGIQGWDNDKAESYAIAHSRSLTVGFNRWMLPYVMIVFTNIPEEQGEWAGNMALAILDGVAPDQIPMTANQRWNEYINIRLLKNADIHLPRELYERAVKE